MESAAASKRRRRSAPIHIHEMAPVPVPGGGAGEDDGGGADHISNLLDDNLHHIISLLPTKEAARTRILASRWRHLWCFAPFNLDCRDLASRWRRLFSRLSCSGPYNLDFDLTAYGDTYAADEAAYTGLVATILSSHQGAVRRFCVDADILADPPGATTDAWFRSAAFDNLEELEFSSKKHSPPISIFRFSPTLRAVTIEKTVLTDAALLQGLHLPVLKHLGLSQVVVSEPSLHSLIAGCPALECLLVDGCVGVHRIRIESLSLVSVGARVSRPSDPLLSGELVIENAPCLQRLLLLHGGSTLHVTVVSAPKLETLGFLSDEYYCTSRLVFGSTVIQGSRVTELVTVVRTVKTLSVNLGSVNLDTVIDLMRCFPCLEKLYIRLPGSSGPSNLSHHKHGGPIKCPDDIRLKKIVLGSYQANKAQLNFAKFFVLNARALESMTLEYYGDSRVDNKEFLAKQCQDLELQKKASRGARFYMTTRMSIRSFFHVKHVRHLDVADPFACK